MRVRVRHSALFAAVAVVALTTTACWRVGNLDGPGTGTAEGRTGDAVNVDKSVVVDPVGPYQIPVIAYADPVSHRLRVGIDRIGTGWHFDDVDGPGTGSTNGRTGDDVGTFVSGSLGGPATLGRAVDVYYFDATSSRLRHGHFDGSADVTTAWNFGDVDGPGTTLTGHTDDPAGMYNAATLYAGHPTDLYMAQHSEKLGKPTQRLRHFWFDGNSHFEDVDGIGGVCTGHTDDDVGFFTAAIPDGVALHAFYYDATAHTLRHARYDGSTWTCETLDGAGGGGGRVADDVGQYDAVTQTADGHLHLFYLDATTHRLRHANFDGSTWTFEDLDGPGLGASAGRVADQVGSYAAAAPNAPGNTIDVVYSDDTAHSLRHAQFDGSTWRFETIDGTGALTIGRTLDQVGQFNALAYGGTPVELQMWTGDLTSGNLRWGCSLGPGTTPPAACS